jgi:hypothetical protein
MASSVIRLIMHTTQKLHQASECLSRQDHCEYTWHAGSQSQFMHAPCITPVVNHELRVALEAVKDGDLSEAVPRAAVLQRLGQNAVMDKSCVRIDWGATTRPVRRRQPLVRHFVVVLHNVTIPKHNSQHNHTLLTQPSPPPCSRGTLARPHCTQMSAITYCARDRHVGAKGRG